MKNPRISIIFFLLIFALSGCTDKSASDGRYNEPDSQPAQTGPQTPPSTSVPQTPPPDYSQTQAKCGLENCHGMDFVCGENVPDSCTEEYQLGDFCRQYAICETIGDVCQLIPETKLDACIACVQECADLGGEPAFECEFECRDKI